MTLIDITLIVELFKNLLNNSLVVGVGRSDELIVGSVQKVADFSDLTCNTVNMLLRGDTLCGGDLLNLLTVLVRAGLEENIVAL